MSELKTKILFEMKEDGLVTSEIIGNGRHLCAMLASCIINKDTNFSEILERSIEIAKYYQENIDSKDEAKLMAAINDILANHKPSKK
ncbi:MAG: hypothetical protein ACWA6U_07870 [Breznakibacter sp.]